MCNKGEKLYFQSKLSEAIKLLFFILVNAFSFNAAIVLD